MAKYSCNLENDRYVIFKEDKYLTTPSGKKVTTLYKPLADRILHDLDLFGENYHSVESILSWHYTLIENFASQDRYIVSQYLYDSFLLQPDWTCSGGRTSEWYKQFGEWLDRQPFIAQWLDRMTHMQLTAACCVGKAYESLNVAFSLAVIMERFSGAEREDKFRSVASLLAMSNLYGTQEQILDVFKTFELYYGIHLEEDGPILGDIVEMLKRMESGTEDSSDAKDTDELLGHYVTLEQLIGRNFKHYTEYDPDLEQEAAYTFPDFELSLPDEEHAMETDFEEEDIDIFDLPYDEESELAEYMADDCWVKRIVNPDDPECCFLLYLALDDDQCIDDVGCVKETAQQHDATPLSIDNKNDDIRIAQSYEYVPFLSGNVQEDAIRLEKDMVLPLDFSFIGKQIPQKVNEEYQHNGSTTEFLISIQSAYRFAYMTMEILTNKDGVIEKMIYTTYRLSGNDENAMVSRPVVLSDRADEAVDMLLFIYDMYTDEELAKL